MASCLQRRWKVLEVGGGGGGGGGTNDGACISSCTLGGSGGVLPPKFIKTRYSEIASARSYVTRPFLVYLHIPFSTNVGLNGRLLVPKMQFSIRPVLVETLNPFVQLLSLIGYSI